MGIFWELMQEEKLNRQNDRADTLEARVEQLEQQLEDTRVLLRKTLVALEEHLQKDIDGDGQQGRQPT